MNYAILDNDHFYTEGLRYLILRDGEDNHIATDDIRWNWRLPAMDIIIVRCRFSLTANQQTLLEILSRLENSRWNGRLFLCCNAQSRALATRMHKRYISLEIHLLEDGQSLQDTAQMLAKGPADPAVHCLDLSLTDAEFTVLNLLTRGFPVRRVARTARMTEKIVSQHKCNALKKLNVPNLFKLLNPI
ncbi:response regulator transcription factor [Serratia marcescens]|uniref:LuxR C-terminal-related transcriptional regulator n=1 Tax=Serratia marcescens TaxID=615 RepID=UPI003879CA8A|nr:response regulator transcription factor [Serratia marcescens]